MRKQIIGISCLFIAVAHCIAADDAKIITRKFTVAPGGTFNLDADQGDIELKTGNETEVEVVIEREARGSDEAIAKALKKHKVTFTQDHNNISVVAQTDRASHSFFSHELEVNVHFHVTVPKRFDVKLDTSGGNVKVSQLNGKVDAHTSGGDMHFRQIGGTIDGTTSGGNVRAEDCSDEAKIQTSGGNIAIKNFTGATIQADTSGGNIDVTTCTGKLQVQTSGGNIEIHGFSGPAVYAATSGGEVSVEMLKQPTGNCSLHSSGGSITARLADGLAFNLAASTLGGEVNSSIPVTVEGKMRDGTLNGKINGGGPPLVLQTSGGDIQLVKQ